MKSLRTVLFAAVAFIMPTNFAAAAEDVVIVYDASGSMWGQINGVSKIEIARDVMADLVNGWSEDINLGLVAYGHRRQADCSDIETLIEPGPLNKTAFIKTVNSISPKGRTPISASVQHAADALSYRDNPATVILISDGVETCQADPCAISEQLAQQGVKFTAHVIGFDIDDAAQESLACIAENTGGVFVPAQNADELHEALAHVQNVMDLQPVIEATAEEPDVANDAGTEVHAPEQVITGSSFAVSWSPTMHPNDYVTIVPAGADEGTYNKFIRIQKTQKGQLVAPAKPGLYEVRYVQSKGALTLARTKVEVVEADVSVSAPEQVTTGSSFAVSWSSSIHPNDYVTIVPAGADEGTYNKFIRVQKEQKGQLVAPAEPGLFEVRYVLSEGARTLASTTIEVVEAEVGVAAPERVTTGSSFAVSWSSSIHPNDYVTIVPAGADEGTYTKYIRVQKEQKGQLVAPAEPGLFEVRYVLSEGARTLASTTIEVVEAEVGVAAPERVTTGSSFAVTWSSSVHPNDYVTIVPAGADEGTYTKYIRVQKEQKGQLVAPAEPGLFEVRYVLSEGARTLASTTIEVLEADVNILGPEIVRAKTTVRVTWSGTVHPNDYITIVPSGADEGSYGKYVRVADKTQADLQAPEEPGLYQARYVLAEGARTLAQYSLEVVAADAALDDGAGLSVPTHAAKGETVTVSWTGGADSTDQRIAIARANQADFSWVAAHKIGSENTMDIKMPNEAGSYEIRFLDIAGRTVLGRSIVEVK